jgi:DNA-binding SARP family transcriptional activator/Tfp pilus assembly protein PilF
MDFSLLGPVVVLADGRAIDVGPPQRCAVLAALAVDAGKQVAVETLIDRVWGEQSPERVRRALHAHVARIRRLLEQDDANGDAPARVVRRAGGYALVVDPDRVDLHRFRHLCERAREPARTPTEQVALLREALELWHGEPLAGLAGQWAVRMRQTWRQQHLDAVLAWARAELRTGNPAAVVLPLTDLVGDHPFLEPLVAVLMRALYLSGDATQALDLYAVTRRGLVEELGVEPGAELRRVHQGILRDDLDPHDPHETPAPAAPAPVVPPAAAAQVPAQLPRDVGGFTGRVEELTHLDRMLSAAAEPVDAVEMLVLSGTAGVGKTALAVHWAHRVRDRFPDGQLYVNLRGFDPGGLVMTAEEAARGFLEALGVPPERIPVSLDAQAALYRSRLAGRRMLVLLDNARDADQVRPLLPGEPGCLVVVTSRNHLAGLVAVDGAQPLSLDLLSREEARQLLARRLGAARVAKEPDAVQEIISRCARLPLALAIVAARAATHPHFSLTLLAKELFDESGRLDALDAEDSITDVRAVFSWSYRALSLAAARLFRQLGLHPGPDISASAAASLAGLPPRGTRPVLAELTGAHLLVEHVPARYNFHDLLRTYAAEQARGTDDNGERQAATHRVLDHYLHTAHAGAILLDPHRVPLALGPPCAGVVPEAPGDIQHALTWFSTEHPVLLAAIEHAAAAGLDTHTWQLAWTLVDYLPRRGHWHDQITVHTAAVAAARRLADLPVEAQAHNNLALAHSWLGRLDRAQAENQRALDLYREAGDRAGEANSHLYAAVVWTRQGHQTEALAHSQQALDLYRAVGHRVGQADALNNVGWFYAMLGDHNQALAYCEEALALHQELGNLGGAGTTLDSLGQIHQFLGHYAEAVDCLQQSLDLVRGLGDRPCEANTLGRLGDCHQAAGNPAAARAAWQAAIDIRVDLDHPDVAEYRAKLESAGAPAGDVASA